MLIDFFMTVRQAGVPASIREYLDLVGALEARLAFADIDAFYLLARTCLVKDEKHFDKFDKAFGFYFDGLESIEDFLEAFIPDEWLRKEMEKTLSKEQMAAIKDLGSLEKIIEEFKKRLEEQKKRHQGGNKWIGTGGTSPFGAYGYNPAGVRVGGESRHKRAVKVWEKREFRNLDDSVELGTRNIKVALRRLRKLARTGAAEELDIDDTIRSTARNAGLLDVKMVPERHNAVKVLIFFDVGGSMDPYIRVCEELFSAARSEFKHMEYFYFHNFIYEGVWRDNLRRSSERESLFDIIHTYGPDYKVIFVGDAAMAPYEVVSVGGSVEHWNDEPGEVWFSRLQSTYRKMVWLNPEPESGWGYTQSIGYIRKLLDGHMYPLTMKGIEQSMGFLSK